MRIIALTLTLIALVGCAAGAPLPTLMNEPVPVGKSKLTITRADEFLYLAVDARIDVNGVRVTQLGRGQAYSRILEPGATVVTTDAWGHPGRFSVSFIAKPDTEYLLGIEPRGDSFLPGALFGLVGAAIDASINENSGAFQIAIKEIKPTR